MRNDHGPSRLARLAWHAWAGGIEPINLIHFVTRRCDARCTHCFIDFTAPPAEAGGLSVAEVEKVAARVGAALVNVNITGGEPFLHRELWPICAAWLRHSPVESVYITTHGGFPERMEALARQFLAADVRGRLFVAISLDNFAAEHDRHRRVPGLYDRALDSYTRLAALADDRLGVGIAITVAEHNHGQVLDLYRHLREAHGVEVLTATLRRAEGAARPLPADVARRVADAYAALTRAIVADRSAMPRRGARRSRVARVQDAKDDVLYAWLREDALHGSRFRVPCTAGRLLVVLSPEGTVAGCEVRDDADLGNLRDFDFDIPRLLRAPAATAWRRRIREGRCHCTYECAQGVNIVASPGLLPRLALGLLPRNG